jgi:hypothetical protein
MPTDYDIYRQQELFGKSSKKIAEEMGLSYDSVRGRISRASKLLDNRVRIAQEMSQLPPARNVDVRRQQKLVEESKKRWNRYLRECEEDKDHVRWGLFLSDAHLPEARWDAYRLMLQIVASLGVDLDLVSGYNDLFEMKGYGRWEDHRSSRARLWSESIDNAITLAEKYYEPLRLVGGDFLVPGIIGNHDLWFSQFHRDPKLEGTGEKTIADFMEAMQFQTGTLHFNPLTRQNWLRLSRTLVWSHGVSAAKRQSTIVKNNLEQAKIEFNTRLDLDVVTGHTHRSHIERRNRATHVNSGTMGRLNPEWLKKTPGWTLGFVLNEFTHSGWNYHHLIEMHEDGNVLKAQFRGTEFSEPLDQSQPQN